MRVSFMVCSLGRTKTSTATVGSGRLERFPGRGYKTTDVLVCLRTRSAVSLSLRSCREASPICTSCLQASSRSLVVYSVPPRPLLRGWREPDSTITWFWMASRLPPAATRTGRAHANLPSSCRTQKWRRALFARVARIRHIVNSRNRALYLLMAVSALLSASSRFLISLFNLLAYSLSYSLRSLS